MNDREGDVNSVYIAPFIYNTNPARKGAGRRISEMKSIFRFFRQPLFERLFWFGLSDVLRGQFWHAR